MLKPSSAIYDCIAGELARTHHEPDGAPITVVCEPLDLPGGSSTRGVITMRLKSATTPEESRAIASTLQAVVKGPCQLKASGDEAV